jgi:hypothetical protein
VLTVHPAAKRSDLRSSLVGAAQQGERAQLHSTGYRFWK